MILLSGVLNNQLDFAVGQVVFILQLNMLLTDENIRLPNDWESNWEMTNDNRRTFQTHAIANGIVKQCTARRMCHQLLNPGIVHNCSTNPWPISQSFSISLWLLVKKLAGRCVFLFRCQYTECRYKWHPSLFSFSPHTSSNTFTFSLAKRCSCTFGRYSCGATDWTNLPQRYLCLS